MLGLCGSYPVSLLLLTGDGPAPTPARVSPDFPSYLNCQPAIPRWFIWLLRGGWKQAWWMPRGSGTAGAFPPSRRACGEQGQSWDARTLFSPGLKRGPILRVQSAQHCQNQPGDHESMTRPPSWKGRREARSPTGEPGAGHWASPLRSSRLGRGGVGEGCSGEVPGPAFLEYSAVRGAMPSTFKFVLLSWAPNFTSIPIS